MYSPLMHRQASSMVMLAARAITERVSACIRRCPLSSSDRCGMPILRLHSASTFPRRSARPFILSSSSARAVFVSRFQDTKSWYWAFLPLVNRYSGCENEQVTKSRKPVALDLCCGKGGWTAGLLDAGWEVVGVDIDAQFMHGYKGAAFVEASVIAFADAVFQGPSTILKDLNLAANSACYDFSRYDVNAPVRLIVASPPCDQFSRHDMPWTRRKNPPPPDTSIWKACQRIAQYGGLPIVIENVRGAQQFMGKADSHYGSFYLWGHSSKLGQPPIEQRAKQRLSSRERAQRAVIPHALAFEVGEAFFPEDHKR